MQYPLMPFLHYIIRSKLNNIIHVMEKTKTDLHLETDIWEWFFTTLWSFRWYVATFQQHLHISVYFRVCVSHQNFVARGLLLPKKTLKVPSGEASYYFKGFLIAIMTWLPVTESKMTTVTFRLS